MVNYSTDQKEKLAKKQSVINQIMLIPLTILLAIIPLIVRMNYVTPKDGRMNILFGKVNLEDFYSQYKATGIIVLTIIMLFLLYLFVEKGSMKSMKSSKYSKIAIVAAVILAGMTILSTLFSNYKEIATWGMYDRAEGMVMWLCYLIIWFYSFYCIKNEKGYKYIIGSLIFLVSVTAILGFFQYIGHDLLIKTKWGLALVIPEDLRSVNKMITSDYESHKILGTLYHYNYVGSFAAMMVPLFAVLTVMVQGIKKKVLLGIITLASLFVLLGSTSRAGLIGLIGAILVGAIIFGKSIIKQWKKLLLVMMALIIVLVGLNGITQGSIFSRIPTLVQDISVFFEQEAIEQDYKKDLPVREVINEEGKVTFVLQEHQLTIEYKEGHLKLGDEIGQEVKYTSNRQQLQEEGEMTERESYHIEDPRFSQFKIIREEIGVFTEQNPINAILVTINETGHFAFKLEETGLIEIDSFSGLPLEEIEAPQIGFKGKERLGSARGYIWSRSLPVFLKQNLLIGNGPDTFTAYFPQNDRLAKWWAYGVTNMIIDKPHNLYLQIGMNQGGIALIAFLVFVISYLVQCFRLYAFKFNQGVTDGMGIGILLAIVGYLGAGIFNDSIVSVAPIFWVLLGTGMAVNRIKEKELKEYDKELPSKVIPIKNR